MAGSGTSLWRKDLALQSSMTGVMLMTLSRSLFSSPYKNLKPKIHATSDPFAGSGRQGPWRSKGPSWAHSRQSVEWWRPQWWWQARWWWGGKLISVKIRMVNGDGTALSMRGWWLAEPWKWNWKDIGNRNITINLLNKLSSAAPWCQDWLPGGRGKPLLFHFVAGSFFPGYSFLT